MTTTINASTVSGLVNSADTSGILQLQTASTAAVTIDASQRVGIGVTPSAWGSAYKPLQINAQSALWGTTDSTFLSTNEYVDSAGQPRYIQTGTAMRYRQDNGSHIWSYAASGTAGNALTYTQAMTLNASGDLGIGTASPSVKLDVSGSVRFGATSSNRVIFLGQSSPADNGAGSLEFQVSNTVKNWAIRTNNNVAGALEFCPSTAAGGTTYTTPSMIINSNGNLLVGTTTQTATPAQGVVVGGADSSSGVFIGHANGTPTGNYYMAFSYNGSAIGSITQNGTTNVAYNTSSDYRLKENIQPMQNALATVAQLKPVTYKWKTDGSDGQGFIAHELQAVVPDCVTGDKDGLDDDGNPKYQGVDTSFLVATLTAALQETKALIDTQAETINALTARIVALEK